MSINNVIREKRKEAGFTQEQVAEALGVSAPAVNKWEKGATYPDVSLLPPLARLLNIDLNTLFCFDEGPNEQEITRFVSEAIQAVRSGCFEDGFSLIMEKVREYPSCGALLCQAALFLDGALIMSGMETDRKSGFADNILRLYERAAECGSAEIQARALFMLASKYMNQGELAKAEETLARLPETNLPDKTQLKAQLLIRQEKYREAAALTQRRLVTSLNELQMLLLQLANIAMGEGSPEEAAYISEISQKSAGLFGLWGYMPLLVPIELAAARKDIPESLSLLDKALAAALTVWDAPHSPLYRHAYPEGSTKGMGGAVLPGLLSDLESSPKYDFLREVPEFKLLLQKYRAKCS